MMRTVGTITKAHLAQMQQRGLDPKEAVDATVAAAKERYPGALVAILKSTAHDGFDVIVH